MATDVIDIDNKVEEGKVFSPNFTQDIVSAGASVYTLIKVGTTKSLNAFLTVLSSGQFRFESFGYPTTTADGTTMLNFNRNENSIVPLDSQFFHTPTVTSPGTKRLGFIQGSGTNPAQATTSQYKELIKSKFKPNSVILVKITNMTVSNQYVSFLYDVYEE